MKNFFHRFFSIPLNEVIGDLTDDDTRQCRENTKGEARDRVHNCPRSSARFHTRRCANIASLGWNISASNLIVATNEPAINIVPLRACHFGLPCHRPFPLLLLPPRPSSPKLQRRSNERGRGTRIQLAWLPLPNSTLVTGPGSDQPPGQINPERFKDNACPSSSPPLPEPRTQGDGLGIKRLFSQGLAFHRPVDRPTDSLACTRAKGGWRRRRRRWDPRSSSRCSSPNPRRILRGSRVFSGVDTSVDIVRLPLNRIFLLPPPPADNEKSRVRMVVTQSAPVAASCSAIHDKLFA